MYWPFLRRWLISTAFWQCVQGQTQEPALHRFSVSLEQSQQMRATQHSIEVQMWHTRRQLSQPEFFKLNRVCVMNRLPAIALPAQQQASVQRQHSGHGLSNPQHGKVPAHIT